MALSKDLLDAIYLKMHESGEILNELVSHFPYQSLAELNYDAYMLSSLFNVLEIIVETEFFYDIPSAVNMTIQFYCNRLARTEEKFDSASLAQLTDLYENAWNRGKKYTISDDILNVITNLVIKVDGTKLIENVYKLFGILILCHIVPIDDEFQSAMNSIWAAPVPHLVRSKFANIVIFHPSMCAIHVINEVVTYFVDNLPIIDLKTESVNDLLHSCLCIFNNCADDVIVTKLAIKLIENNAMSTLKMSHLNVDSAKKIFMHQIKIIFASIPWNHNEPEENSLQRAIEQYIANEESSNSLELGLVITYLEVVYEKSYNQSKVAAIVDAFRLRKPLQMPALKSLLHLFELYQNETQELLRDYQPTLLQDKQFRENLDELIIYDIMLLYWILDEGDDTLKKRALKSWTNHFNTVDELLAKFDETNRDYLMYQLFIYSEFDVQEKILTLWNAMHDKATMGNKIMTLLVNENLSTDIISKLLDANPDVPMIDQTTDAEQDANRQLASSLLKRFIVLVMNETLKYNQRIRLYLWKLLVTTVFKDTILIAEVYASNFLEFLAVELNSGSRRRQDYAARIFCSLVHAQWKLQINMDKQIVIQPNFNPDNEWMFSLLGIILTWRTKNRNCALLLQNELVMYYSILEYLTAEHHAVAMQYVKQMVQKNPNVACAMINISYIEKHCTEKNECVGFVTYLVEWLSVVIQKYPFMKAQVPWEILSTYVAYLDETNYLLIEYTRLRQCINENTYKLAGLIDYTRLRQCVNENA